MTLQTATLLAALIQGGLTFAAGIFALLAGRFAYRGAIEAAARQVKLEEKRHAARVAAYVFRLSVLADQLEGLASVAWGQAKIALDGFLRGNEVACSTPPIYSVPISSEFSDQHWENHALVGQEAVRAIHKLFSNLNEYELFREDVVKNNLKVADFSESAFPIGDPIYNGDGSVSFRMSRVIEQNEILAKRIVESVRDLGSALAKLGIV